MKRLVRFRYCTIFFTSPSSSSSRSNSFIIDYDGGNNLIDSYCYYHHIMGKNQLKLPEVIEILYGDSLYESIFHSLMVRIFYSSDTSSEARQMNRRQILLMNLLNRRQRFNSDACRLTLKDMDQCSA